MHFLSENAYVRNMLYVNCVITFDIYFGKTAYSFVEGGYFPIKFLYGWE